MLLHAYGSNQENGISLARDLVELIPLAICNAPAEKVAVMITCLFEKRNQVIGKGPLLMIMGRCWSQICQHLIHGNFITSGYFKAIFNIKRLSLKPGAALSVFSWLATGLAIMAMSTFTASAGGRGGLDCNKNLPPGDYYLNPVTGCYVPWDSSNAPKTDFVNLGEGSQFGGVRPLPIEGDCENPSRFSKNVDQIGAFLKVSRVNDKPDADCEVSYDESEAKAEDRAFYGVGMVYDKSKNCKDDDPKHPGKFLYCSATATLFGDRKHFLTNRHAFQNRQGKKTDPRLFSFYLKVWVPAKGKYDWVAYKIKRVVWEGFSKPVKIWEDLVEVELEEAASETINGRPVPSKYWVDPFELADPMDDSEFFAQKPILAGFWEGEDYTLRRSCHGVNLSEVDPGDSYWRGREDAKILFHNGNTTPGTSGAPLAVLKNGKPKLVAVHSGTLEVWGFENRNIAIDARAIREFRPRDSRLAIK